ncbi:MAG TPA: membrane protein insertase YidC [Bacteroidia bacterium]|nr:membrane protein insertase YidC [Bacteroidia bacterium]
MDRKSLLGLAIIAMLLMLWMTWGNDDKDIEARKLREQDSLAKVEVIRQKMLAAVEKKRQDSLLEVAAKDTTFDLAAFKEKEQRAKYGFFYGASSGNNTPVTIENNKIKATLQPMGGMIGEVELKGVKTHLDKPLLLFKNDSARFGLEFFDTQRRRFKTDSLFFKGTVEVATATATTPASVTYRLYADSSTTSYIEYKYTLKENDYMLGMTVTFAGCDKIFSSDTKIVDLVWVQKMPSQEKNIKNERLASTVYFRFNEDENIESLSLSESEEKEVTGSLKWVSFKQQYFSSFIIADKKFDNGATVGVTLADNPYTLKTATAILPIPFDRTGSESFPMKFYFGPNDYHQLESYGLMMEDEMDLGWGIFGWLNKWVFMPIFYWLGSFGWNYGLVILLLTVIVKVLLFPIAYKSYLSSAKMRVLKPEMDALNEKHKDDDPMKKQQATMGLYKKAGVNPAAGCIPLLLQIPILFALLRLFPSIYELRQSGFWWAPDLSTYDSIWEFGYVPIIDSIYGDHVSLWALLMTISTLLYTWMNQQTMSTGPQLPGMKWLIYLMPLFFLSFLNSNAAALSYYYFVSNMITFGQMALMRRFVDEKAIHAKIEDNKKKPVKQGSGFMQRLEQAQKKRMEEVKQQGKGKKK